MIRKKINTRSLILLFLFWVSICVSVVSANAQQKPDDYAVAWKTIDSLIKKKGLTLSAQSEVDKIYIRAKKEHNDPQMIKALLYQMTLFQLRENDAAVKNIALLENEINSAREPARSILVSILAETYWDYFQKNRYRLYRRTAITGENEDTGNNKNEDLTTWGRAKFHKRIGELYQKSLKDERLLQETDLSPFDAILSMGTTRNLRPTLFDLLAHRALDYFKSDERDLDQADYTFEIDDTLAFSDKAIFTAHSFVNNDSLSLHFKALTLFQRLIRFHLKDNNPSALLDVDIERIGFVSQYGVMENKENLYRKALENLTNAYPNEPIAAQAWYLQARLMATKAEKYAPTGDTSYRYSYIPAEVICKKVIQQKDSSEGQYNCYYLLATIEKKELSGQTETVNLPDQPFRALVRWRNCPQLYGRVVKMDRKTRELAEDFNSEATFWKTIAALPFLKEFTQVLPATGDHQLHRAEIKIDPLPVGEYALILSGDKAFSAEHEPISIQYFSVSGIAFINRDRHFFVLQRESGQPMAGASVQVWEQKYNYNTSKYSFVAGRSYTTDTHGYFYFKKEKNNDDNQTFEIKTATDRLFLYDARSNYSGGDQRIVSSGDAEDRKKNYERQNRQCFFFTDRSIYRPGQLLYFKGIVLTNDYKSGDPKILIGASTKVILFNSNRERIDSLLLTTNEYGSIAGKFSLPQGQLNGQFSLGIDSLGGGTVFSVEEYKRPKFQVVYDPLKGSYRVYDTLNLTGKALAYSGNSIGGATIKFVVTRAVRYPHPWLFRGRYDESRTTSAEILHGENKTRPDGSFSISFQAAPDKSIDKDLEPVFEYRVVVNVTDINGETRSAETVLSAGYKALELSVRLPENPIYGNAMSRDSLNKIFVTTKTLSGEFEPAKVHIDLYRLQAPDRLIRERFWEQPDQFILDKEHYLLDFPHDEYSNETKKENWVRIEKSLSITDSTHARQPILLNCRGLKAGWYSVSVTAMDKYGQEVKERQFIQMYETGNFIPSMPQYDWDLGEQTTGEPGKRTPVPVGSSAKDIYLIEQVQRPDKSPAEKDSPDHPMEAGFIFSTLSNEKKELTFPIAETDRGGFGILHAFVKDNRFYSGLYNVSVPWTNKELSVSYASYRDKTLPGSGEKWGLSIKGSRGEKVLAEVLTGMYDASLDQFAIQDWAEPRIRSTYFPGSSFEGNQCFSAVSPREKSDYFFDGYRFFKEYDDIMSIGVLTNADGSIRNLVHGTRLSLIGKPKMIQIPDHQNDPDGSKGIFKDLDVDNLNPAFMGGNLAPQAFHLATRKVASPNEVAISGNENKSEGLVSPVAPVQPRKNFNETAFFFPDLRTDSAGNVSFSFTIPEALTSWKWMTLAHTKDLAFGYSEKTIVTQKQLMVQPNAPRFLREGDRIELSAKIVNLTDSEMTGQVELQLIDASTNQSVDGWFINRQANQYFTVAAGQSIAVNFPLEIPYQFNRPLTYRIVARSKSYSDGEENILPVVSNRVLVTESLPLNIRGTGTRGFRFEKLLQSGSSETLNHHSLTVEFSSNPAWYAVHALPYLIEYPYECAEQTFERYYANALAANIVKTAPRIQQIFSGWQTKDTSALLSNLEKNPELKSALLEETPWVLEAKNESQQKKNIALLFDMTRMTRELGTALNKVQQMQSENGGFVWFKGGPDDRYITQTILTGIGHLKKLGAIPAGDLEKINAIVRAGMAYLDKKIIEDYEQVKKRELTEKEDQPVPKNRLAAAKNRPGAVKAARPIDPGVDVIQIQYLYLRSLFKDLDVPGPVFPAMNFYRKQTQQHWLEQNRYMQGMIALSLFRTGDIRTAQEIAKSLKQNALTSEEMGMYWKDMQGGYYWYQAPIETQSLLIEAFREITHDTTVDQNLKTWLLKQKQTQSWSTTKATADACYALLLGGSDWLAADPKVEIQLGSQAISSNGSSTSEAGTGYFKKVFPGTSVKPEMGNISVTVSGAGNQQKAVKDADTGKRPEAEKGRSAGNTSGIAWGAVYWQYFENADKITNAATVPLKLSKALFLTRNTDRGPVLEPVQGNAELKVGDKVTVRIELKADRDMEYVHLKDMRASCMEPTSVLSEYKWQNGLGYYETTKDASTNFFFDRIPRGSYVFEYTLFVSQAGNFSNGITTIQCMYAPEFNAHSEGIRVSVTDRQQ